MKLAGAYINDDKYERLVALAEQNNRTLAGQCRHLFDRALSGELQVPQCAPAPRVARAQRPVKPLPRRPVNLPMSMPLPMQNPMLAAGMAAAEAVAAGTPCGAAAVKEGAL